VRRALSVAACTAVVATTAWLPSASAAAGDRPDTFAAAQSAHVSANGKWLRETLSSTSDRDWFRFTVANSGRALVRLGHLPANYSLAIFDAQHHVVVSSDRAGQRFEQIYHAFPAGDYFVRVASTSGANANVAYLLNFRPLARALVIAESRATHSSAGWTIRGELLNNTASWLRLQRLHVTWFNKHGVSVGTCDEGVIAAPIAPLHRIEFDIENGQPNCGDQPANAASYRLRVFSAKTADRTPPGLVLKPGAKSDTPKQRIYRGTVTNKSDTTLTNIYATVIEYDGIGRALAFGYDKINALQPGQTRTYSAAVDTQGLPQPNSVRERASITD
jgi:hypothetical protein